MLSHDQLVEIRARAAACDPGPWSLEENQLESWIERQLRGPDAQFITEWEWRTDDPDDSWLERNLRFIAESRTDIPELLDHIRSLERSIEVLKERLDRAKREASSNR